MKNNLYGKGISITPSALKEALEAGETVTLANTVTRDAKESITISSEAVLCRTH